MAATENHKSHNSKEENNNIGEEEPISLKMDKESNEEEPISVKIENEDDSKTLTIGKLKVRSFASLTNHPITASPIDYNQTGTMGPDEMQHLNSTNLYSFPIARPFGFPRPIYNQQRFVANTSNFRPNSAFNPFLLPGNLPPHFPLAINNFGNQLVRSKQYVPLKIPSVNSSQSCQTRPSPSRLPLGINSDVKIQNIDAQRPLAPIEPCIRIPDFKVGSSSHSPELIDVKPDINSLAEQMVKEEVDLDVTVETSLETSEVANMDIVRENAEKLKQDVKLEANSCSKDDVYDEEEENEPKRVSIDHKAAKHSCQGCFFSCNSASAMKRHREKMHTSKSKFVCTVGCKDGTPYETFDHLVHHVATVHKGEKRWQCRKCGKSYKSRVTYKNHLSPGKCKIVDPYACHECTFTCITYSELERHQLKHRSKETEGEPVECPFCNRKLTKRRITAHINAHHVENDKTFNCDQCEFFCKSLSRLKIHYKRTAHNRPYQCLNCKLRFITEEGLMNHDDKCPATRGLPPAYVCQFEGCKKRFNLESRYETHVKLHSLPEEDFFHCAEKKCDYKSTNRQSMDRHYAKTKHYRPFQCPDCYLRFTRESSLSYHIGRLHVAQILRKTNALRRTPSPVTTTRIDDNEEVDSEQVAVANFQNGWLGISGFDPGEMTDAPAPDVRDCTTNEDAGDNFQYILPEVACVVECEEEESKVTKSTENDSGSETETCINEYVKIEEMDVSV